jgi:hypothetical protein
MVSSFSRVSFTELTHIHICRTSPFRLHNNYIHCYPFREDHFAYGTFRTDPRWRSHPHFWDRRLPRLAFSSTKIQLVEFEGIDNSCDNGLINPSVWLFGVPVRSERPRPVRGLNYARRVVWTGGVFRLVHLRFSMSLYPANRYGQVLYMARFRVMREHFTQNFYRPAKKRDGQSYDLDLALSSHILMQRHRYGLFSITDKVHLVDTLPSLLN